MIKLALLPAAAALLAAPALASTPLNFERNGITYVASVTDHDGVRRTSGHEVASHRTFDLQVANGRVTGIYGGDYVSYPEPTGVKLGSR